MVTKNILRKSRVPDEIKIDEPPSIILIIGIINKESNAIIFRNFMYQYTCVTTVLSLDILFRSPDIAL
jgi:hypothetical protein